MSEYAIYNTESQTETVASSQGAEDRGQPNRTSDRLLRSYNGERVEVLSRFVVTEGWENPQPMAEVRAEDGSIWPAFDDELVSEG